MYVFNGELLDMNLSRLSLIILSILLTFILISIYFYIKKKNKINKYNSIVIALLISAGISSSIDRIFWKGSLDFIKIFTYIFDLKYVFLTIALILL